MTKISIIIPVLNEAENIANLLTHLIHNSSKENIEEIIVVDGGSSDSSQKIVNNFIASSDSKFCEEWNREANPKDLNTYLKNKNTSSKILLLNSDKGRAKQMNLAARHASGNILYFLHADSFPPKDFDKLIIDEVTKGNLSGCFKMRFDSNHWWLQLVGWFTRLPWFICRGGDQSLFINKDLFHKLGEFNEAYIIYEDNIIIKKLFAVGSFKVIQKPILTSARLYKKHGVWKLQYHFFMIHLKYFLGANAEALHTYYKKHIA